MIIGLIMIGRVAHSRGGQRPAGAHIADARVIGTAATGPRRSLDVNLADAGLSVSALGAEVSDVFAALGQDPAPFLARHGHKPLGHVAAGAGRDDTPFATVYFGATLI